MGLKNRNLAVMGTFGLALFLDHGKKAGNWIGSRFLNPAEKDNIFNSSRKWIKI